MILYLYAIVDGLDDVTGVTGVAEEPLTLLRIQSHAVIGGWMTGTPPLDRDHLAAQGALVHQLHQRAASLLPLRFGTSFPSVGDAERAIKTMSAGLDERLTLARWREQMTIRVLSDAAAGWTTEVAGAARQVVAERSANLDDTAENSNATAGLGTRYLAARAARATPPEVAPLLEALKPLQRATRVEPGRRPGLVATIYQLIERGTAGAYRETAQRTAAVLPGLTARITGPSPCYAFM